MKFILTIFLFLYAFSSKAEISDCKFSPVTLINTDDWEKFKIQEWHNCFGELYQNYNKKNGKILYVSGESLSVTGTNGDDHLGGTVN